MDISRFSTKKKSEEGVFLHLEDPETFEKIYDEDKDGKPIKSKPMGIVVRGTDSKAYRSKLNELRNKQLKNRKLKTTAEKEHQDGLDILAALTVSFVNMEMDGQPVTPDQAQELYDREGWIRKQVDEFAGDFGNFTQKSTRA